MGLFSFILTLELRTIMVGSKQSVGAKRPLQSSVSGVGRGSAAIYVGGPYNQRQTSRGATLKTYIGLFCSSFLKFKKKYKFVRDGEKLCWWGLHYMAWQAGLWPVHRLLHAAAVDNLMLTRHDKEETAHSNSAATDCCCCCLLARRGLDPLHRPSGCLFVRLFGSETNERTIIMIKKTWNEKPRNIF